MALLKKILRCKVTAAVLLSGTFLIPTLVLSGGAATVAEIFAAKGNGASNPSSISIVPSPPILNAEAYTLLDYNSGQVIAEKNMDKTLPPASLTKLMTAYIVENMLESGRIKISDKVRISEKAWKTEGSTMFLEPGEKVSVLDLLKGLIVVSGNDAAVALAEYVAGSEDAFVQLMNATAAQMGLKNTHFEDVNGLPNANHYSSAYDLAMISWHIIHDHPDYYSLYAIKEFQHGVNRRTGKPLDPQSNRVTLLWSNPAVDGLKTGHTMAAGYCLATSSKQGDRRLIAVVLNSATFNSRDVEAQKLLTYGYRFFTDVESVKKGVLKTVRIWKGKENRLPVGMKKDIWVTVPKGKASSVKTDIVVNPDIKAPVTEGQQVGTVKVTLDGKLLKEAPVIAEKGIEKGSLFKRIWDSIILFFRGLF